MDLELTVLYLLVGFIKPCANTVFIFFVFLGSEAVDWMVNNEFANTREEAVLLGQEMLQNDVFHHVAYDHTFKDEYLFYRFPVRIMNIKLFFLKFLYNKLPLLGR